MELKWKKLMRLKVVVMLGTVGTRHTYDVRSKWKYKLLICKENLKLWTKFLVQHISVNISDFDYYSVLKKSSKFFSRLQINKTKNPVAYHIYKFKNATYCGLRQNII